MSVSVLPVTGLPGGFILRVAHGYQNNRKSNYSQQACGGSMY